MKEKKLRILYVAYSLLPIGPASCGGAEQALLLLQSQMQARGHSTTVAACSGSQVAGELFATGDPARQADTFETRDAEHIDRILDFLRRRQQSQPFDLVHDHGGSFWKHAAEIEVPVLATLHLPRSFYPAEAFARLPSNLAINCVSTSQAQHFPDVPQLAGVVRNGVDVAKFPFSSRKHGYLLWIGRICLEKGAHLALDVANTCGIPIVLAGEVYPFSYHQQYFQQEMVPRLSRLNGQAELLSGITVERKLELLSNARAVVIPSLVDETSSLVAMEAMACGTPVVGFHRGALPEVIANGRTGFLVNTVKEMIDAVSAVEDIDARACREHVEQHFAATRVGSDYEQLYRRMTLSAEALSAGV
jgi:glycosyltransferase involved in cell wall biosynthesis